MKDDELEWVETKSVTINSILKALSQCRSTQSRSSVPDSLAPTNQKHPPPSPCYSSQGIDTDTIKVNSASHWHERTSHVSYTCPCMHGIRPIGIALDT